MILNAGTGIVLEVIPEINNNFSEWSGDLSGSSNPDTFILDGTKHIMVKLDPITSLVEFRNSNLRGENILESYPNPFNQNIQIRYSILSHSQVTLSIYNQLGILVYRLIDKQIIKEGTYDITWAGNNYCNDLLPSGVYFLELIVNPEIDKKRYYSETIKLLIVRE